MAREAGVAISTVSKVLNHYPNVSEETKQKVNAAIAQLGFVPNTIASALSSKKTGRMALVLDVNRHSQKVDEIPMRYIIGAINKAKEKGMDIITVFFTMIAEMDVEEMIRYFQSQSIEGLRSGAPPTHSRFSFRIYIKSSCGCFRRETALPPHTVLFHYR